MTEAFPILSNPAVIVDIKLVMYPIAFVCAMALMQRGTGVLVDLIKKFHDFLTIFNQASLILLISYIVILAYVKFG